MSEPQRLIHQKAILQQTRAPLYRKIIRWAWFFVYAGLIGGALFFVGISLFAIPSFEELENPRSALASEVLGSTGEVLDRYFIENRVPVGYGELSPHLVHALVSTEDERFYKHCGVDPRAVLRVMVRTILLSDQSAGGGSTITQQLAKMLYSDRKFEGMNKVQKLFALGYRKFREWITAVKLERSYTKEEIMAMYLNQVDFVNNAYGIHSAAEVYFNKSQQKLNTEESATLIGMLQNPSRYNPVRFPDRCIRRRMIVLYQIKVNGYLTEAQYDSLKVRPLDMSRFKKVNFSDGTAPYFCSELKKDLKDILQRPECRRPDGTVYDIYKDGLRIYTTIDPAYQALAEAAMAEHMKKTQARFFQVWSGRDPWKYKGSTTTDEEIQARQQSLWSLAYDGDRFQATWPKYFDNLSSTIQERYGFELRPADVERMLAEEKTRGSIDGMVRSGIATPQQAAEYRRFMASSTLWPEIKKQWRALDADIRKQFNTKTKMKVFTWANSRMEKDTTMTPLDSLKYHRMFLQAGMMAIDPTTSEVKAWVGGINFKNFKFDHVRSQRQVGSTFKPYVYATAIAQQGMSPCFQVYDQAVTIPPRYQNFTNSASWTPKNSTGSYSGRLLTLREALKNSVNSVSAFLMKQLGDTEPVRGLLNNMGIDSSARRPDREYRIPKQPSICLGAADLTVFEMTGAYNTFANNGVYAMPMYIRKIEDKNGRVIFRSLPEEKVALPPNANYVLVDMLKYNVAGAPGLKELKSEVGGKTGTTNDYSDGWFMGVTPRLVVGTWVGGEDRWIRFLSLSDGQGARMARPIFAGFVSRLEKDNKAGYDTNARFKRPPGDLGIEINCAAYQNTGTGTDEEEEFSPDPFNDELPKESGSTPKQPAKKPESGSGQQ
jgi:penicillin-binding protein 1A